MPYFEIDESAFNALGDDVKAKFKAFEPEDTKGLKDKANQLLTEKKQLELDHAKLKSDFAEFKNNANTGDAAKLQSQLDDAVKQLEAEKQAHKTLLGDIKKRDLTSEATKIAAELTKDSRRQSLLAEKIAARIDIDNGNVTVLDLNGNPTVSSVADLTGAIKKDYDFLCDGSSASGGGANGGSGGAANTKQITRGQFNGMGHAERASFFKDGGKVVND